jgi:hypothetical protein
MDDFNYSRIEAALNSSLRITDFSDEGIMRGNSTSGTVSGDILKVVSYFDSVTKKWPERVGYKGPLLSRHEAVRSILRIVKKAAFRREIAEALVGGAGIYPPRNIMKIISTNEFCISGGRYRSFSDEARSLFSTPTFL